MQSSESGYKRWVQRLLKSRGAEANGCAHKAWARQLGKYLMNSRELPWQCMSLIRQQRHEISLFCYSFRSKTPLRDDKYCLSLMAQTLSNAAQILPFIFSRFFRWSSKEELQCIPPHAWRNSGNSHVLRNSKWTSLADIWKHFMLPFYSYPWHRDTILNPNQNRGRYQKDFSLKLLTDSVLRLCN